jgi:hypothetical protein
MRSSTSSRQNWLVAHLGRVVDIGAAADPPHRLQKFEDRTEWPLAAVAVVFLIAYSVQVLARPQARMAAAMELVIWITWGLFFIDYFVRLYLRFEPNSKSASTPCTPTSSD